MQVNPLMFHQLQEEQNQVSKDASNIAMEATEALRRATSEFSDATAQIKAEHKKEMNEREKVIKALAVSLMLVSGLAIYLGIKSLTLKC